MADGVIDITKPNTAQTMANVIASTRDIGVQADIHIQNTDTAHGMAAILAGKSDYEAHKANTTNAHSIDVINARALSAQNEVQTARGTKSSLNARLSVAMQSSGALKLTSLASRWIDNGDTPTYSTSLAFTVPGDRTKVYLVGSIIRATVVGGYVYGIVASATYSAPNTAVTFHTDYPVLTSPINKVEIALLSFDNTIEASVAQNAADIFAVQSQVTGLLGEDFGAQITPKADKVSDDPNPAGYIATFNAGGNLVKSARLVSEIVMSYAPSHFASAGAQWTQVASGHFTATPASTSRITMLTDLTGSIFPGMTLAFAQSSQSFIAQIKAIASNYIDIRGPALDTGAPLTALAYGGGIVRELLLPFPGRFSNPATTTLIASYLRSYLRWIQQPAYIVRYGAIARVVDQGGTKGKAAVRINNVELSTASGGLTLSTNATWYDTEVDIKPTVYRIVPGDTIEVATVMGTQGDAEDLTVSMLLITP